MLVNSILRFLWDFFWDRPSSGLLRLYLSSLTSLFFLLLLLLLVVHLLILVYHLFELKYLTYLLRVVRIVLNVQLHLDIDISLGLNCLRTSLGASLFSRWISREWSLIPARVWLDSCENCQQILQLGSSMRRVKVPDVVP